MNFLSIFCCASIFLGLFFGCKLKEINFVDLETTLSPSEKIVQIGTPITFNQNATIVAKNFSWDFGNNIKSNEKTPTHQYSEVGIYNVTLISTKEDQNQSVTKTTNVQVLPKTYNAPTKLTYGTATDDETGYCMERLQDGSYLFVGVVNLSTLWIVKTNAMGVEIWNKKINDITSFQLIPKDVKELSDDNIIIVGKYIYNPARSDNDAFIVKLDKDGNLLKKYTKSTTLNDEYVSVMELPNAIIAMGTSQDLSTMQNRARVEFFDDNLNLTSDGNDGSAWQVNNVQLTPDGFFVAISELNLNTQDITEKYKPNIVHYTPSFGEPRKLNNFNIFGQCWSILPLKNGDFLMTGETLEKGKNILTGEQETKKHAFVSRIKRTGQTVWTAPVQTIKLFNEDFYGAIELQDGSLVAVGTHENPISKKDIIVTKFSPSGQILKTILVGGMQNDEAIDVEIGLNQNSLLIFGTTQSYGAGKRDFYVVRLNENLE
jgi:PKD repeat protein